MSNEAKEKFERTIRQCSHAYFYVGDPQHCEGCGFSRSYILGYKAGRDDKWVRIDGTESLPNLDGSYLDVK